MADREKVINHFQDTIEASGNNNKWRFVRVDVIEDAIELLKDDETQLIYRDEIIKAHEDEIERLNELLKEQEPVESEGENCGECGYTLHRINYDGPDKELRHEEVSGDASER